MAEILMKFVKFGFKIKDVLEKAGHNAEVCRMIGDLLHRLRAIAKHLQGSPNIMEDDSMRDMVEGLHKALQRASKLVAKCESKSFLSRAFNVDDIARKLHGVCLDVQFNMISVQINMSAVNNSMLAELKENVAQLHARIKYTNSMLPKILKIVKFGLKIKRRMEKAGYNAKRCRKIDDLLCKLSNIAQLLQVSPKIMQDDLTRDTTEGLDKALQRASKLVAKCEDKGFLCRASNADDIAEKLSGVCLDVLLNMRAVQLANGALNNSMLAELIQKMAQLRANIKILKIVELGLKIKRRMEKAGHNGKRCRRNDDLLRKLSNIAQHLQGSPKIMEDNLMRDMAKGLDKALQRASKLVAKCKGKGSLRRASNADYVAEKLSRVCLDVQLNMSAVLLANSALKNSVLAELKENMAQLCTNIKYTNSMFANILKILAAHPDVHLPKEVKKLVKDYQIVTAQNKNKREAKKKNGVPSSQSKKKK